MHAAEKAALRERLTAARRARAVEDIERARADVRAAVLAQAVSAGWRCVAGYVPMRTEPGSPELLSELTRLGIQVLVPVLLPDRDLDWAPWDAEAAKPGAGLGRDTIAGADAVFVPALAVAADGVRIGRGGGSYDRALPRARPDAIVAALLFDGELVAELPRDEWDHPVTAVVTPGGWRELGAAGG
jgi:5-formyltetrahydrofolate cyclo-ligase